jgi:hypothetical protein
MLGRTWEAVFAEFEKIIRSGQDWPGFGQFFFTITVSAAHPAAAERPVLAHPGI